MLTVYFGRMKDTVSRESYCWNAKNQFDYLFREEWLLDDFAQRILRDVEDAVRLPSGMLYSNKFQMNFGPKELSGGTKIALYLHNAYDGRITQASLGQNVVPFIEEVGTEKDIFLQMMHLPIWSFKDPKGIRFIGLPEPTKDMFAVCDLFHKRMAVMRAEGEL